MDTVTRYVLVAAASLAIFPSNARADQSGSAPVHIDSPSQTPAPAAPAPAPDPAFARWLDVDAASISIRYRLVRGTSGTRFNQAQTQDVLRGRVKLDAGAHVAVGFTVQSGAGFPSSWNNTGLGTGDRRSSVFLKHLFADVTPIGGVEAQYGGLGLAHGENSEMTAYDNDGYLVGGRVSLRRPKDVFFDDVTVTVGYLGDLTTSNVFTRFEHLDRHNFTQILVAKHLNAHVQASTDYVDNDLEGGVWRAAGRFTLGARFVDAIRVEYGSPRHRCAPRYICRCHCRKDAWTRSAVCGRLAYRPSHVRAQRRSLRRGHARVHRRSVEAAGRPGCGLVPCRGTERTAPLEQPDAARSRVGMECVADDATRTARSLGARAESRRVPESKGRKV